MTLEDGFALTTEARALWISRFDWGSPPLRAARLDYLLDRAADAGFNIIFFQVRAMGDAYYAPGLEPWAYRLTGTTSASLGRDPAWDPLAHAIRAAHSRGLELHAYVNVYSIWECGRGQPPHTLPEHPFWSLGADGSWRVHATRASGPRPMSESTGGEVSCHEYVWGSPGVERINAHNLAVIQDIVTRYAVDGIHLDRVRYPGRQYSHDPETLAAWQACNPPMSREDWQRSQISAWVAQVRGLMRAIRPAARLSAAVWFTYRKTPAMNFPTSQGYHDYFQDSHRWLVEGSLDALVPMIYGPTFDGDIRKWRACADSHAGLTGQGQVWLGVGGSVAPFEGIMDRIDYARGIGTQGVAVYSAGGLEQRGYWERLKTGPFRQLAIVP
jgi:uncharacterized lipoprotein YddW (UPF0748 family)